MLSVKGWIGAIGSVVLVLSFASIGRSCQRADDIEPVTYLLPKGYTGPVYVVYGVKSGREPEYKGDRRIYRIPDDGILLTQMPVNEGWVSKGDIKFFYVSANGERVPIPHKRSVEAIGQEAEDQVHAVAGSIGNMNGPEGLDCEVHSQRHAVGDKSQLLKMEMGIRLAHYLIDAGIGCGDIIKQR